MAEDRRRHAYWNRADLPARKATSTGLKERFWPVFYPMQLLDLVLRLYIGARAFYVRGRKFGVNLLA